MLMRSAASRVRARKPLVVSGTLVPETLRTTHEPSVCRRRFGQEKCSTCADLAVADHHVRLARTGWARSRRGISLARVLVVGVGVDDDVGAQAQAGVEAGHEARGQALAAR